MTGDFEIHGDNILECERAFELFVAAVDRNSDVDSAVTGPDDSFACPQYSVRTVDEEWISARLFPGFGRQRWDGDVRDLITTQGGILREAPDAIVCRHQEDGLDPVLAIEYCSALDAGNQAWQRHGRAYSCAQAGIPFLYISEIGGAELDVDRSKKSIRTPNPLAPYSFLIGGKRLESPLLPTFTLNPEAELPGAPEFGEVHGGAALENYVFQLLRDGQPKEATRENLEDKVLHFVEALVRIKSRNTSLDEGQWTRLHEILEDDPDGIIPYLRDEVRMDWSKRINMDAATDDIQQLLACSSDLGLGLTSTNLPFGLIPAENRTRFAMEILNLYEVSGRVEDWLASDGDLVVCWVAGYKRSGRDARPDRGLPPMARMLVGEDIDMLSIVYGPTSRQTWDSLRDTPQELMEANGLWQAILGLSDAVLVDSYWHETDTRFRLSFTSSHWEAAPSDSDCAPIRVSAAPTQVGEHDVDTVLHNLFRTNEEAGIHEGFCNPPGGDWSYISLLSPDQEEEHRWLSLRRVPEAGRKRPDHVVQFFPLPEEVGSASPLQPPSRPICVAAESKESRGRLREDVGEFLKGFIRHLLEVPANVARRGNGEDWRRPEAGLDLTAFQEISCVALLASTETELQATADKAGADFVVGVQLEDEGRACRLHFFGSTEAGRETVALITSLLSEGMIELPDNLEYVLYDELPDGTS